LSKASLNKKAIAAASAITILMTLTAGFLFLINFALTEQIQNITKTNEELTKNLQTLNENYTALRSTIDTAFNPPKVVMQLGIKLMQSNNKVPANHLWITGEVGNNGTQTLYNVRLRFTLTTNAGNQTSDYVVGTINPGEFVTVRTSIFALYYVNKNYLNIKTWRSEPVATYLP